MQWRVLIGALWCSALLISLMSSWVVVFCPDTVHLFIIDHISNIEIIIPILIFVMLSATFVTGVVLITHDLRSRRRRQPDVQSSSPTLAQQEGQRQVSPLRQSGRDWGKRGSVFMSLSKKIYSKALQHLGV